MNHLITKVQAAVHPLYPVDTDLRRAALAEMHWLCPEARQLNLVPRTALDLPGGRILLPLVPFQPCVPKSLPHTRFAVPRYMSAGASCKTNRSASADAGGATCIFHHSPKGCYNAIKCRRAIGMRTPVFVRFLAGGGRKIPDVGPLLGQKANPESTSVFFLDLPK